jgi:hypothetical protein
MSILSSLGLQSYITTDDTSLSTFKNKHSVKVSSFEEDTDNSEGALYITVFFYLFFFKVI